MKLPRRKLMALVGVFPRVRGKVLKCRGILPEVAFPTTERFVLSLMYLFSAGGKASGKSMNH
jgi:hypothetical protein